MDGSWTLAEHLLLRRAGFPYSLLDGLACPEAAAAATEAAAWREEAEACRERLLREEFPAAVKQAASAGDRDALRALSRWRRKVGTRRATRAPTGRWPSTLQTAFDQWRAAEAAAESALDATARAIEREGPRAADRARRAAAAEPVREAVFLLSPDAFGTIDGLRPLGPDARRGARERSRDRLLYRYLQRLAAKNETTSFFGPLTYCTVDDVEAVSTGPETPRGVVRREVHPSFWAVAVIARLAARDPALRAHVPVRRLPLPGEEPEGLADVDGARTTADLAQRWGVPLREADRRVADFERAGLARRDLEPLSTTPDPLGDLEGRLPDVPGADRWRRVVAAFREHLAAFAGAALQERVALLAEMERWFTEVTGRQARRSGGEMYADRGIFYEDCLGDAHPFVVPRAEAERITDSLGPVLDLCATYGRLRHEALRALATEVLDERGGRMPFTAFAEALADAAQQPERAQRRFRAVDDWLARLHDRVLAAADEGVARLRSADLADLIDAGDAPRFVSPDVMLERRPAAPPRVVLGELHPYVFAWGSQGLFAPEPERFQEAFRRDLAPWGGPDRLATVLRRRQHKGLVTEAFPGRFVEVSGLASDDAARRLAVDDLVVAGGPDGPELLDPEEPLSLYCGEDDHPHLQVFGPPQVTLPPVRLDVGTPRIEIDDVVVQRARWEVPDGLRARIAEAASPAGLLVAAAEGRRAHGWPRWVFAHAAGEPKPLHLDLESGPALEVLRGLAAADRLELVEMLPGPDALWLERSDGLHTSELRIALWRS